MFFSDLRGLRLLFLVFLILPFTTEYKVLQTTLYKQFKE